MTTQISLRLSDEEHENLKASAAAGGRTVSQEVRYRLFTSPMHQHIDALEDVRIQHRSEAEKALPKARIAPIGLSKKDQAGGKYDR